MEIQLTQEDIDNSKKFIEINRFGHSTHCPIATAVKRALGNPNIVYGGRSQCFDSKTSRCYKIDEIARKVAMLADNKLWNKIKPCVFNLDYP